MDGRESLILTDAPTNGAACGNDACTCGAACTCRDSCTCGTAAR